MSDHPLEEAVMTALADTHRDRDLVGGVRPMRNRIKIWVEHAPGVVHVHDQLRVQVRAS
ncbi:MAG: hypothetical protein QOD24_2649 [Solirubrobacteraceae bacterium]|nr:hypothetical protein [Solirubrobacteraceae bacterium]